MQSLKWNMMGKEAMSDNKKELNFSYLTEFKIPSYVYEQYYEKIKNSGELYTIVPLESESGLPELMSSPSIEGHDFLSFAFFRKEDAIKYKKRLIQNKRIEEGTTFIWRCNAKSLFYAIEDQAEQASQKLDSSFSVIIAVFLAGEFRDMEIFWTNNPEKTQ